MFADIVGGVFGGVLAAALTVAVIVAAVIVWGIIVVARRRDPHSPEAKVSDQERLARTLLVRLDDAVRRAEDEVGFAIAQFGRDRASGFAEALDAARTRLREAFELQQRLDDAQPETLTQRRDWTARIVTLCRESERALEEHTAHFTALRRREQDAPRALAEVDALIEAASVRRADAEATLESLRASHADTAITPVADALAHADTALANARRYADDARRALDSPTSTAADAIDHARDEAHRASRLLDAPGELRRELRTASEAVERLESATRASLAEARLVRDRAPDPENGIAVAEAIARVDAMLAERAERVDPLARLESLRQANAALDASLAASRNQERRLEGARTALAGALVQARSQLATTRGYVSSRQGIGAASRTRLAEAERLLMLAENEADPVLALDLARSSITHSRDADALARYDLLHR